MHENVSTNALSTYRSYKTTTKYSTDLTNSSQNTSKHALIAVIILGYTDILQHVITLTCQLF